MLPLSEAEAFEVLMYDLKGKPECLTYHSARSKPERHVEALTSALPTTCFRLSIGWNAAAWGTCIKAV